MYDFSTFLHMLPNNELFESYLGTLPKSPLTEAVTALYEGLTKSDMALGKHLKSLDGGTPIPKPSKAVAGETQHQYVRLARKPKEIGAILSAGAKGDSEALANALKQYNSDEPQVDFTGAVKQLGRLFASVTDKEQLETAAKQFAGNDANSGYQTLQSINGFNLDLFVKSIRYGVEERKHDSDYMTMNPDAKQSRVMNKWLFHGTSLESAIQIAKHGFDRGNKVGDLAYNNSTGNGDMKHDYSGDYLFAFDAEDITDNRDECQNGKIYKTASYGPTKVMFKASGYKIYHHGDNENQVIFDYHEPDSCFLLIPKDKAKSVGMPVKQSQRDKWEEDYQVVGQGKDGKGKVLYAGNGLKPCIRWVVQNGDTYSKFMFKFH